MEDLENEEFEETKTPLQHALKFGLILGMVGAVINLLLYVIDPTYMVSMWMLLLLLLFMGLIVYGGISYRNEIGGYINFGPAYIHGFSVFVVMGLIGLAVNFLMYNVVDTSLPEILTDASAEQARSMAESFGATGDTLDEVVENARTDAAGQFSTFGLIKGFLISLIVYAVLSLITALIVRKQEKVSDIR
jgi:uncharacterized membrane protein